MERAQRECDFYWDMSEYWDEQARRRSEPILGEPHAIDYFSGEPHKLEPLLYFTGPSCQLIDSDAFACDEPASKRQRTFAKVLCSPGATLAID